MHMYCYSGGYDLTVISIEYHHKQSLRIITVAFFSRVLDFFSWNHRPSDLALLYIGKTMKIHFLVNKTQKLRLLEFARGEPMSLVGSFLE